MVGRKRRKLEGKDEETPEIRVAGRALAESHDESPPPFLYE
jgi:hypothetical protein